MLFPRVLWKLSRSIAQDPKVDVQSSSLQIDGDNVALRKLKVPIRIRWLDRVASGRISKHAVAGHLDIECVEGSISKAVWQYPFDTFSITREALQWLPLSTPYEPLVVRIPVQLQMVLLLEMRWDFDLHFYPMRRPAGSEGRSDMGLVECM